MNELEKNLEQYRTAKIIAESDFSQIDPSDFDEVGVDPDENYYGNIMGVSVPVDAPPGGISRDIGRGLAKGALSAGDNLNKTLPLLGLPVDLINEYVLKPIGLDTENPVLGSKMIEDGVNYILELGQDLVPKEANVATQKFVAEEPSNKLIQGIFDVVTEFGLQAVTPALYLRAFTVMTPFARGLAWGGISDFINSQPNEQTAIAQLTNLLSSADENTRSAISDAVLKVFEKRESDPEVVSKARAALEGMVLGGAIEKGAEQLVKVYKYIKGGKARQDIVKAGQAADERIADVRTGNVLSANPVGMASDMAVSAAGRLARGSSAENPNSINTLLYNANERPAVPTEQRKWTKASLARSMQEKAEAEGSAITEYTDVSKDVLSTRMANEAASALEREGNASDWYNSKIVEMNETLRRLHPELTDGSTEEGIFKTGLALTSNGSTVDYNLKAAEHVYEVFKNTGKFPTDLNSLEKAIGGFGQEGTTLIKQFQRANILLEEMGAQKFIEFMNTKFTVRELSAMGHKMSGESMDFETFGSAIFGPKIGGGFYQNLRGNFDPVTFDRWWMASWGRWTGQPLLKTTGKARNKQLERFRTASGKKYKNPNAAITAAKKIYSAYKRNNFQPRTELNQAAQRLAEGATDKMREQPASSTERQVMRDVTYSAVEKLKTMGYNVTPADFQATVWYPEKELHGFYGIGSGRSAPDDYAAAAQRLLEQRDAR